MTSDSLPAVQWKRYFSLKKLLAGTLLAELLATWLLWAEFWTVTGLGLLFWALIALAAASIIVLWTAGGVVVHRRFQFGMKTFLVLVLTVGAGLGWLASTLQRTRDQRAVAAMLESRGARAMHVGQYDPGMQSFLGVGHYFQDVVQVDFEDPSLTTDADLAPLNVLKKRLERLSVHGPRVTDAGLEDLAGLTNLKDLSFIQAQVSDAGLVHLRGLTHLERLTLHSTNVSGRGLAHLTRLEKLEHLNLNSSKVNDAGLSHVVRIANIKSLSLDRTQITDAGLAHLAGLGNLERLDVAFTGVSDAGLVHLKGFTKLRWLRLDGTAVTDVGAEELQEWLPNLVISR